MQRLLLFSLLILLVALPVAAQDGEWPRTLTDALGNEVTLDAPPERIVSLSLAADETLLPILGPERFAAVTALSRDPAISNVAVQSQAVENAIVSSEDTEQIIALEPDLVIAASFTAPEVIQQLQDAGITVFTTDFAVGLDAVRSNLRLLGQVAGAEAEIEAAIAHMDAQIEAVGQAVGAPEQPARALYLTPGNYTSGADSTISEIIALAGGVDVAAAAGVDQFAPLSDEFIIDQNPDVIFLTGWTPYDPTFLDTFYGNPAFDGLSAIENDRVYVVNDAHMTTVSQFISEGVEDAAAYLYPNLYPAYPLTLTDATGAVVTIEAAPSAVAVPDSATGDLVRAVLDARPEDASGDEPRIIEAEGDSLAAEGDLLVFTAGPVEDAPEVAGGTSTSIGLYPGTSPAEQVANTLIIGQALGEWVAALNVVARYTDTLEAEAAQ